MTQGNSIRFRLAISADQYLAFYRQRAKEVVTRADDGRTLRFPADALRRFVTHDGITGYFELRFGDDGKLLSLDRLAD